MSLQCKTNFSSSKLERERMQNLLYDARGGARARSSSAAKSKLGKKNKQLDDYGSAYNTFTLFNHFLYPLHLHHHLKLHHFVILELIKLHHHLHLRVHHHLVYLHFYLLGHQQIILDLYYYYQH